MFLHLCVILFTELGGLPSGGVCIMGVCLQGGLHPGGSAFGGGLHPKGEDPTKDTTGYGKQAGGTHPTGMHSC